MSFIEGIGDDFLYAFAFLVFIGIVTLAWFSTNVTNIHFPTALFIIERRTRRRNEEEESERASPTPPFRLTPPSEQTLSPSSGNETQTEHETDNESSEVDEFICEQVHTTREPSTPTILEEQRNVTEPQTSDQITSDQQDNSSMKVIIKFLNDTRKEILANPNDTISKIKELHFADDVATNKMIRFIYQGRELQDRETLRTCNIRDQTVIHCQISARRPDAVNSRPSSTSSGPHVNTNQFGPSTFIDSPPVNISSHFVLILGLILGFIWYLRIKYRMLFSPISTIVLIVVTIIFAIFMGGSFLTSRQRVTPVPPIHRIHLD